MPTLCLYGCAKAEGFQVTDKLRRWASDVSAHVRMSQLVEDGIKRVTHDETRSIGTVRAAERAYSKLIESKPETKEHKFQSFAWQHEYVSTSTQAEMKNLFVTTASAVNKDIDLDWVKRKCATKSLGADNLGAPTMNLIFLEMCERRGTSVYTGEQCAKNAILVKHGRCLLKQNDAVYAGLCVSLLSKIRFFTFLSIIIK